MLTVIGCMTSELDYLARHGSELVSTRRTPNFPRVMLILHERNGGKDDVIEGKDLRRGDVPST